MSQTSLVPPDVLSSLAILLSNLLQTDNQTRKTAEKEFTQRWLTTQPEQTVLALAQLCRSHPAPEVRTLAAVLLRRHLSFMIVPASAQPSIQEQARTLYSALSLPVISAVQTTLLHALDAEPVPDVRRKLVNPVAGFVQEGLQRGRHWEELIRWISQVAQTQAADGMDAERRRDAYTVLSDTPEIVKDIDANDVGRLLEKGLKDPSPEVRLSALQSTVSYLALPYLPATANQLFSIALMALPTMPRESLPSALEILIPFVPARPKLFTPHLAQLLSYLVTFFNPGPSTPTPLQPALIMDDDRTEAQKFSLELLVSLSESAATQCKRVPGWTASIVRVCLDGMAGELLEEVEDWETSTPDDDASFEYPLAYEQAIDRLTIALGGKAVVPVTFQYVPQMLQSPEWKQRHAGLMAIASLGEGGGPVMKNELGTIVALVGGRFRDPNPRVRYAACQCLGQLCTDLEGALQQEYHQELLGALLPTLEDPVPRVHAHAASALINFCEGASKSILAPYLNELVPRLLALLRDDAPRFVQEQALTTLAVVAGAAEEHFSQFYNAVMPVLLNVMEHARGPEYRVLRSKAMECGGLIAMAVGRERFAPDAPRFCQLLVLLQNEPLGSDDPSVHYLMGTWSKVCQTLGEEFEPYLPYAMPPLLRSAEIKPHLTVFDENDQVDEEAFDVVEVGGQDVGIRTAELEEKCTAFENLVVYASKLGPKFGPYLPQVFQLAVPGLQFMFHEGVREASAAMIPQLVNCARQSTTITLEMVQSVFDPLVAAIRTESDPSFLQSLYTCFSHSLQYLGGGSILTAPLLQAFNEASQSQLHDLGDRRRLREQRVRTENIPADERFDLELVEESEDSALTSMADALEKVDAAHPLLLVIGHVRELAIPWASDEE